MGLNSAFVMSFQVILKLWVTLSSSHSWELHVIGTDPIPWKEHHTCPGYLQLCVKPPSKRSDLKYSSLFCGLLGLSSAFLTEGLSQSCHQKLVGLLCWMSQGWAYRIGSWYRFFPGSSGGITDYHAFVRLLHVAWASHSNGGHSEMNPGVVLIRYGKMCRHGNDCLRGRCLYLL